MHEKLGMPGIDAFVSEVLANDQVAPALSPYALPTQYPVLVNCTSVSPYALPMPSPVLQAQY
eukprot:3732415-Rhodomonas_salina.1